jgi:hypothetical protein
MGGCYTLATRPHWTSWNETDEAAAIAGVNAIIGINNFRVLIICLLKIVDDESACGPTDAEADFKEDVGFSAKVC